MSQRIIIEGGQKLTGEVFVGGAKNSVLKLMAAALLVEGTCIIHNVPELTDVETMLEVINHLGVKTKYNKIDRYIEIDSTEITNNEACYEHVSKMRASFIVLGALLGRCKEARVALPGGCSIGERRVDFHIKGLRDLGAEVAIENGFVIAKASRLIGTDIYLDLPSVGATENIMLAAVLAEGSTRIQNAAQEPEIIDLANFLNSIGGDVSGAGTSEIVINGVKQDDLKGTVYTTIPDRIEAGTYMAAVVATRGRAIIRNVFPGHLTFVTNKLVEMGANVSIIEPFTIEISCPKRPNAVNIVTQPYPGFPTDLQSPIMSILATAEGVSVITESLYENRFRQVAELRRMGADIQQDGNHAVIRGVDRLAGAEVKASDLRAGASLIVASLCAQGMSAITNLSHIDRGYEKLEEKLRGLNAKIQRVDIPDVSTDNIIKSITEVSN